MRVGAFSIAGNFFASQGRFPNGLQLAATVLILNFGLALEMPGTSVSASLPARTREGGRNDGWRHQKENFSLASGTVLFNDNQCVLEDIKREGEAIGYASITILSLDDIALQNNQSWVDCYTRRVLYDTLLLGFTSRATANRLEEPRNVQGGVSFVVRSLATSALANIVALNITSNGIAANSTAVLSANI